MPTTPTELELPVETGLSARVLTSGAPGLFVLVDEPRYVARIDPVDLDPEPVNYGLYDDRVRDDLIVFILTVYR